ncbi:hypothetical protein OVA29_09905 [Exiguobacterium sp. SL14]|nr:hypothetical protein [Exiguobacterium sp. SL14]MCY1690938.1 hypothetical protein [Exiguobacterium sp. SL14]
MENMMQLALDLICERFSVGQPISEPVRLMGGLLHETWRLQTTTGFYVLKRLNPEIMQRPEARNNFKLSEDVATKASLYLAKHYQHVASTIKRCRRLTALITFCLIGSMARRYQLNKFDRYMHDTSEFN